MNSIFDLEPDVKRFIATSIKEGYYPYFRDDAKAFFDRVKGFAFDQFLEELTETAIVHPSAYPDEVMQDLYSHIKRGRKPASYL